MEDFFKEMQGKNCFTFLPFNERILCHYTKIGENLEVSVAEEEFKGLQSIGEVFERMFKDARIITVEEYLGFPQFEKQKQMTPEKLAQEIVKIQSLLLANRIRIAQANKYPDDVFYSFLTEDLMSQELYDLRLGDMYCTFVYELIRPDFKSDITNTIEECLGMLFLLDWRFLNFCSTADFIIDGLPFTENRRDLFQRIRKEYEGWLPAEMNLSFAWEGEHQREIDLKASFDMVFQDTTIHKPLPDVKIRLIREGRRWMVREISGFLERATDA